MKLIDLLVKELPKRGGWPEGAVECERFMDEATIDFYDKDGNWHVDCGEEYGAIAVECINPREAGDGFRKESVKKDEYEAALAASQQPVWNGDGLPPVGCECEFKEQHGEYWQKGVVRYISDHTIVINIYPEEDEYGDKEPCFENDGNLSFRPIRTESGRKRDAASCEIAAICRNAASNGAAGEDIYDAIAAGKIPGIKLDGDA